VPALAYLLLRLLFTGAVAGAGLFSPSGLGDPVVLLTGLVVIALRLILLFGAPTVVAYHLVSRSLAGLSVKRRPKESRRKP
jgi:hypothetical protein